MVKLSEFEKGEITALKRVRTRNPTGRPEKLSPQFKRRIVREVKKKTLSTSKILKSLEQLEGI